MSTRNIGTRAVGDGLPVYVIAEIGINHNGSLDVAKKLIEGAAWAGCDAVKFQKRTPEICVPRDQWGVMRDTPWGRMTYLEYRHRMELGEKEFTELDRVCRENRVAWFASCWDEPSVDFIERFDVPCHKVASASLTDLPLLERLRATGRPIILSTGMSTMDEIGQATSTTGLERLLVAHSTSSYPCPLEALNLRMIQTLQRLYPSCPIGYSGHEVGLGPSWAAVAMGATFVERHITLDRTMWGTDQAASIEVEGFHRLVKTIREIEGSLGDGVKRVYESEIPLRRKLRRVGGALADPPKAGDTSPPPASPSPTNGVYLNGGARAPHAP